MNLNLIKLLLYISWHFSLIKKYNLKLNPKKDPCRVANANWIGSPA